MIGNDRIFRLLLVNILRKKELLLTKHFFVVAVTDEATGDDINRC